MNTFAVTSRQQAPFQNLSVGVSQQLFEIIGDSSSLCNARSSFLSSVFSYRANIFSSSSSGECVRSHMDHLVFLREFSGKLDNLLLSVYSSVQCSLMIGMPEHLLFLAACF